MPENNKPNKPVGNLNALDAPYVTSAPTSDFKGMACIKYTENSDTTMTLYVRHPKSGAWRSATLS